MQKLLLTICFSDRLRCQQQVRQTLGAGSLSMEQPVEHRHSLPMNQQRWHHGFVSYTTVRLQQ